MWLSIHLPITTVSWVVVGGWRVLIWILPPLSTRLGLILPGKSVHSSGMHLFFLISLLSYAVSSFPNLWIFSGSPQLLNGNAYRSLKKHEGNMQQPYVFCSLLFTLWRSSADFRYSLAPLLCDTCTRCLWIRITFAHITTCGFLHQAVSIRWTGSSEPRIIWQTCRAVSMF